MPIYGAVSHVMPIYGISDKKRVKITTHKEFSSVKIRSVVPDDSGIYRVKVSGGGDIAINHVILNGNMSRDSHIWFCVSRDAHIW